MLLLLLLHLLKKTDLHYYRPHKALFNMLVFPPGKTVAANTKFKPQAQIDNIRHVVHTWNNYNFREKNKIFPDEEQKAFALFKQTCKPGNE
jgi:hypothetical protein